FKNHISKYKRLGTYTDPNGDKIDVLVVQLKNEWALERSRTMLRNFTSDYLKNRDEKDAALVAYYTTNPDDWRFSYIRMEYKREKTESGKFKITQDITPAKRYSFLVGKNEPNHTAQAQLVGILADDQNNPTLTELETAFSVDAVTKQFYKDYRAQFEKLWNELNDIVSKDPKIAKEFETKTIDTANFAKKLMGQIVFLYFLQKKGWLGVGKDSDGNFKDWGTGPKNFMGQLFSKEKGESGKIKFTDYGNFFNDVLEPLFYVGLASEQPNDYFPFLNCKIPFLNGGLFEPINDYNWDETDIRIDNDLIGDVFKTFDQYNFTVREDEPLEKEVAVDPEMLGKVFENLLPENLRKGKGAYYTPRTIVHYMCQESLINYLYTECEPAPKEDIETLIREGEKVLEYESKRAEELAKDKNYKGEYSEPAISIAVDENAQALDDALANIKVCDPAIGSGAFPVGMLTEIVKARKVLEELYLDKKHGLYELKRHCIQNSLYGVDIDPGAIEIAKLRLWLSLVVDEDDYEEIQPLPNLDYKIMQGNSLIEEFHGISLDIEKKDLQQASLFEGGSDLDAFIDDLHQKQDDFFNAEHPREKKQKREAVETAIINIFHNELGKDTGLAESEKKKIETELQEITHGNRERNFFPWKLYFADVFREKGGFDVVIANPPYVDSEEMIRTNSVMREYLVEKFQTTSGNWDLFVPFIEAGIGFTHNEGNFCYIIPNKLIGAKYTKSLREFLLSKDIKEIRDYSRLGVFDEVSVYPITVLIKNNQPQLNNTVSVVVMKELDEIKIENIIDKKIFYTDIFWDRYFLNEKIVTLLTKLFSFNKLKNLNYNILGAATVSEAYKIKEYLFDSKQSDGKKFINTGTIDPFTSLWGLKPTQYIKDSYLYPKIAESDIYTINATRLAQANSNKIIVAGMSKFIEAFYDDGKYLAGKSTGIILGESEELIFLTGVLNSKLVAFYVTSFFHSLKMAGGFLNISKEILKNLPIQNNSQNEQKPFIGLVAQILTAKKDNPQADTIALEVEIDQLVYKLYGLTDEEIAIVEESVG
ncbi:MAG: hypothetical protein HN994_01545, partial [Candidatus Marinimicrobia bacterium]|nr:hypothetical protein [Candidatus Neomarinimicrobiota bacterium]